MPRRLPLPEVLRNRNLSLYLGGIVLSRTGTHGTFAAMLFQVYVLTGSTLQVGLVGLSRGLAVVVLSPLGGYFADRLDRRRLLQTSQAVSLTISLGLAVVTLSGRAVTWHVLLAALLNSAAATFDSPARKALVTSMVPREDLVKAFALLGPANQIGGLVGPGLSGALIALGGPGLMYAVDAVTYAALIVILAMLSVRPLAMVNRAGRMFSSIVEGASFIRRRPVIFSLIGLDLSVTLFAAYRIALPAIAVDIMQVGATGYGLLAGAPAAGALVGAGIAYRLSRTRLPSGAVVLASTALLGIATITLAQTRLFIVGLAAVGLVGLCDAIATVIRNTSLMLQTPDRLRGRVSSLYSVAAEGGPALGELNIGWLGGVLGVSTALTLGGFVPLACALLAAAASPRLRGYRITPAG